MKPPRVFLLLLLLLSTLSSSICSLTTSDHRRHRSACCSFITVGISIKNLVTASVNSSSPTSPPPPPTPPASTRPPPMTTPPPESTPPSSATPPCPPATPPTAPTPDPAMILWKGYYWAFVAIIFFMCGPKMWNAVKDVTLSDIWTWSLLGWIGPRKGGPTRQNNSSHTEDIPALKSPTETTAREGQSDRDSGDDSDDIVEFRDGAIWVNMDKLLRREKARRRKMEDEKMLKAKRGATEDLKEDGEIVDETLKKNVDGKLGGE